MKKIDVVVPSYNEEESLPLFYEALCRIFEQCPDYLFNFIFVDDGSSDNTLKVAMELARKDERVKYISFSRNFGKEAAIYAGLKNSTGDMVVLMDADLQHPPELIPEMIHYVDEEGYGACGAKRKVSGFSKMFSAINNRLSKTRLQSGATDYMLMSRQFVDAVMKLAEVQRFTKGLFAWVGFKVKWLDYKQGERLAGTTKWSFKKLVSYAGDGIVSFSTTPLRFVTVMGAIIFILAIIYALITLILVLVNGKDVPGYASLLIVMLFLGGVIMLALGIIGEYISGIYMEAKDRPIYIEEKTNIEHKDK